MEPFTDLVGCPLNGTWTLTVNDLFAIDNGYICDWSINFDPTLFCPNLNCIGQFANLCDLITVFIFFCAIKSANLTA